MINKIIAKCPWLNTDNALLILRIGVGALFIFAGWNKVSDIQNTIGYFGNMGLAPFWAYLVAYVEFLGGIAILLGIYTRFVALLLSIIMVVAIIKVGNPMMAMTPFITLVASLALVFAGAGKLSVDSKWCKGQ